MSQRDDRRSSASTDQQIDIVLYFISAVQHLGRYQRLGLSVTDALQEARDADFDLEPVAGFDRSRFVDAPGAQSDVVLLLSSLQAWTATMGWSYNQSMPWPHPVPAKGWPGKGD